ncbi:Cryptochrome-2 [Gonapodya sp. JEL0774]|nr:Cryptochrome-2 [Gonapodya sp. JEL0774]
MEGNPVCLQVPWRLAGDRGKKIVEGKVAPTDMTEDERRAKEDFEAWKMGRTGYPWIDGVMRQLRLEGWIHHLARHAVACFLTRGDLYISWERGAEVFEEYLLDADHALNVGNWLWLSSSAFFTAYFRVYHPVSFAKKYDKKGIYAKRYVKEIVGLPEKYVWEPDYPAPIVVHDDARKANIDRMAQAYKTGSRGKPDLTNAAGSSSTLQTSGRAVGATFMEPQSGATGGFGESDEEAVQDVARIPAKRGAGVEEGSDSDEHDDRGFTVLGKRRRAR